MTPNEAPSSGLVPEIITPIHEIVQTASNIEKTVQSTNSLTTKIMVVIVCITLLIAFLKFRGCLPSINLPGLNPGPTVVKNTDTTKPITQTPTRIIYTPKPSKTNPNPTSIIINKPVESTTTIKNGNITVQNSGFVIEPKLGYSLTLDGFRPYLSARIFFVRNYGIEIGANDQRAFLGVDYRLPILNMLFIAGGGSISYLGQLSPYLAANVQLALF